MKQTRRSFTPWGRVAALLVAALVTMIGVLCRLEPMVILQRASWAALVTGVTVALVVPLLRVLLAPTPRRRRQLNG